MRFVWGSAPLNAFDLFEFSLLILCVAVAFFRPSSFKRFFAGVENRLASLSKRRWRCALIVFLLPIALRLLLLPVYPPPLPFIHDEYAYLMQADTFAHGRLANPPLPFPGQFETIYILATPTYSSEYEPAQGFFLAIGEKLFNQPWFGVVLTMGLFCAVAYWALMAWFSPPWAFTGALLLIVEIGVLSYWMNSYWGGCIPAIGGTLTLGALARLRTGFRRMDAVLVTVGIFVLLCSRPLEGILLAIMVIAFLLFWLVTYKTAWTVFATRVVLPMLLIAVPAGLFLGYYNERVTGKFTEVPYMLYRARYSVPQGFYWQKPPVAKNGMPADIKGEYLVQQGQRARTDLLRGTIGKLRRFGQFYIGIILSIVLFAFPFIWRNRNMDIVFFSLLVILVFENLTYFAYFPHYTAAVAISVFVVLLQCLRVMRGWGSSGLFLSRAIPTACCLSLSVAMAGKLIEPVLPAPVKPVSNLWKSQYEHWISREKFVSWLEKQPGKQLVLIQYNLPKHDNDNAWTFNLANLDDAKIVWARESPDPEVNRRLIEHFKNRKVWLAQPDATPKRIIPYPDSPK